MQPIEGTAESVNVRRHIFNILVYGDAHAQQMIRKLLGCEIYTTAKRTIDDELVVLISNKQHEDPFALYAKRWHIEIMFNKHKTKGFNLENSHITNQIRILSLFTIIAICYSYSCLIGAKREELKPIRFKTMKNIKVKMFDTFRYGLDLIQHILFTKPDKLLDLIIQYFSCGTAYKLPKQLNQLMLNF